jgi:hypothetical protein
VKRRRSGAAFSNQGRIENAGEQLELNLSTARRPALDANGVIHTSPEVLSADKWFFIELFT